MLVLARSEGQSIWINEQIQIVIVKAGKQVKVGINAPEEFDIRREEHFPDSAFEDAKETK